MTTGAATGSGMAQWKSVEDGWPPKRPGCQHTLAFIKANNINLEKWNLETNKDARTSIPPSSGPERHSHPLCMREQNRMIVTCAVHAS
jgi:hypothetical protein